MIISCVCLIFTYLILCWYGYTHSKKQQNGIRNIGMRHFVLMCNKGPISDCDILLQDLKKCRVDLIARCINSALIKSHCIRNNTKISFFCGKDKDSKVIITFDGDKCKHLKPDERTLAAMIKHCLHHGPLTSQQKDALFEQFPKTKVLKGINVITHSNNFCSFVQSLTSCTKDIVFIINLTENGYDINKWIKNDRNKILKCCKFIVLLGDSIDIPQQCIHQIKQEFSKQIKIHFIDIKIGNMSLLSSHCIVLFHHYIDSCFNFE